MCVCGTAILYISFVKSLLLWEHSVLVGTFYSSSVGHSVFAGSRLGLGLISDLYSS